MKKHSYIRAALSVAIVGVSALAANIARAAEPSAFWDDFRTLDGAYELTVDPSCTIDNGVITIGANGGMTIAYPTKNPFTVIAEMSDCPSGEATIFSGLFNNPTADADLRLVSNGDVLKHVWTDSLTDYGSASDWDRERHVVALAYQSGETTYIDGTPKFSGGASSSRFQVVNIYVGMRKKADGTISQVATGMKVYRLAIFEAKLSDAEVAEAVATYFSPKVSIQVSGDTSISAIEKLAEAESVDPQTRIEAILDAGATVLLDKVFWYPRLLLASEGDVTLKTEDDGAPSDDVLEPIDIGNIKGTVTYSWYREVEISGSEVAVSDVIDRIGTYAPATIVQLTVDPGATLILDEKLPVGEMVVICDGDLTVKTPDDKPPASGDLEKYDFTWVMGTVVYSWPITGTFTYEGFLTTAFVDTGWKFYLLRLNEAEITGTMSGASVANRPAPSTGYWVENAPSESEVARFQMQVYQDNRYVKAVEVELKKGENGNVWIRGVRAGYVDNITSDPEGAIRITNWGSQLATSEDVQAYGVNKVVVKFRKKLEVTLDGDKTWSELLAGHDEPSEEMVVEVKTTGDWTLTLDKSITCAQVSLIGEKLTVTARSKELITDSIAKFNTERLTDSLSFVYNVTTGYAAPDDLKNIIKSANAKRRFVFKGAGENGVTLDYGETHLNTTLSTHIVFDGGKHALQMRNESAGLKFGANASPENPTLRVTGGAYLVFNARNICGWSSGVSNANGIIRVDDGSTAEIIPTAGTCYWAQQIYLEPGATLAINDNGTNFRVNGGTGSGATAQFYVPDNVSDMTDKPAIIKQLGTGGLYVNGQGTTNMAVYVGENSKLIFNCNVERCTQSAGDQVTKYGAGILESSDGRLTDIPTWQLMGGTLVYDGELATVNLNGATLVGNEMVAISDTLHVAGGDSTAKNVMFFGTTFNFGNSNTKLIADNFVYSPVDAVASSGNGVVVAKDLTINKDTGLPSAVGLDVNSDDGILRLVATEWETGRKLCGGTLSAPNGKVKRTIYLGDKAYKTKVLFDTGAKTIKVFKPGLLFFVQ